MPRQKEVIYLLYYDCLSETEAGIKLGISRSTIRTHKKRALKKLERKLARWVYCSLSSNHTTT
ncbi:RNA polymerase sigma factor [Candidatus Sordicultor fermentans]|uniref:RNA polymerase sigma factor n=1 Tax=Candidatus Sordicultor fermentans TaxID=1953203 RepID=UPI0039088D2B